MKQLSAIVKQLNIMNIEVVFEGFTAEMFRR
jgi:hypothetical protein